jgi:predicted dehydrogenase
MTGVGLIGLGMVGKVYAKALHEVSGGPDGVRWLAIAGRTSRSCEVFRVAHGADVVETVEDSDWEGIAVNADIGFAIVATPPNARREIVERLAKAGKHILMEKPVERSLAAATELVEICERAGVQLGIMFQHRARPSAVQMRAIMAEGTLGALHTVEVAVPWWRDQSYYDAPGRGTYERDGGGVLISQAIHTLDLMLSLTGPVAEVSAMTATSGYHKMDAEDFVSAGLRFECGAIGSVFATVSSFPGRAEGMVLGFENASVTLMSNSLTIHWRDGRCETYGADAQTGAGADPMAFTHEWHRDMIVDFARSLSTGAPPLATGRDALDVHRLIAAIETSGRDGVRTKV